ncbi:hypothetical protein KFE98_20005 [bacterium SCSIO 12741]|nr:hypothetical protein KFE98_20005 [bacterium SCSIO 12741]
MELDIPSEELNTSIQDRISRIGQAQLKRAIEQVLDRYSPQGKTWYFNQVQLNLDPLRLDHLEDDLIQQVSRELALFLEKYQEREALELPLPEVSTGEEGEFLKPDRLAWLGHYLLTGSLPWGVHELDYNPDEELQNQLNDNKTELLERIRDWGQKEVVRARLAFHFEDRTLRSLVRSLEPSGAESIFALMDESREQHRTQPVVQEDSETFNRRLWQFVLHYLLVEKGSHFDRKTFVASQIRQMADFYHLVYAEVLDYLHGLIRQEDASPAYDSLIHILKELKLEEQKNEASKSNLSRKSLRRLSKESIRGKEDLQGKEDSVTAFQKWIRSKGLMRQAESSKAEEARLYEAFKRANKELPKGLTWQVRKRSEIEQGTISSEDWEELLYVGERDWLNWSYTEFESWKASAEVQRRVDKDRTTWQKLFRNMEGLRFLKEWKEMSAQWHQGRPTGRSFWTLWKYLLQQRELGKRMKISWAARKEEVTASPGENEIRYFLKHASLPAAFQALTEESWVEFVEHLIQDQPARFRQLWQSIVHQDQVLHPRAIAWVEMQWPKYAPIFRRERESVEMRLWMEAQFRNSDRVRPAHWSIDQLNVWVNLLLEQDPAVLVGKTENTDRLMAVYQSLEIAVQKKWIFVLLNYYSVDYKFNRNLYFKSLVALQRSFGVSEKEATETERSLVFQWLISNQPADQWPAFFVQHWRATQHIDQQSLAQVLEKPEWKSDPLFKWLKQSLGDKVDFVAESLEKKDFLTSQVNQVDVLLHLLITGSLPWWGKDWSNLSINELLKKTLKNEPTALYNRLLQTDWKPAALSRFVEAMEESSNSTLTEPIVRLLLKGHEKRSQDWLVFHEVLLQMRESLMENGVSSGELNLWFSGDPVLGFWEALLNQSAGKGAMSPASTMRWLHNRLRQNLGWDPESWNRWVRVELLGDKSEVSHRVREYLVREWQVESEDGAMELDPALGFGTFEAFLWEEEDKQWELAWKKKGMREHRLKWIRQEARKIASETARRKDWNKLARRLANVEALQAYLSSQVSAQESSWLQHWLKWSEEAESKGEVWGHWKVSRQEVTVFLLKWLFRRGSQTFDRFRWMSDFLEWLSLKSKTRPEQIVERMQKMVSAQSTIGESLKPLKVELLKRIAQQEWKINQEQLRFQPELKPQPLKENSDQSTAEDDLDSEYTDEEEDESPLETASFIRNAGLVLLNPYLPQLFSRLEYLEGDKFKSKKTAYRAVHLLQYIVTGEEHPVEHHLLLNKYLCGLQAIKPIEDRVQLKKEEKEMADGLLQAIIQQWNALGSTSVDGLRQTFLQREGKIQEVDDFVRLQVETKAFDVLLDRLPWSYHQIKYSWMKRMLFTEWRQKA